jgi:RNA polymerase-binding transcription factor DksA
MTRRTQDHNRESSPAARAGPVDLKMIRSLLDERYRQLTVEIRDELMRSGEERYADIAGQVKDPGDESVASLLADLDIALVERQVGEIRDIEAARQRIAEGTYGICIDCGGEIEAERLKVYPTAKRCFACQSQREKIYAQEGKPTL